MIYLDNNATTEVLPEVRERMLPFLGARFGNPSSLHGLGSEAADAISRARSSVARLLGARSPRDVVFTSGGTESIHLALLGSVEAAPGRTRLVTSAVEHGAVLAPLERLEARRGYELVRAGVDPEGRLDVQRVLAAIDERTALVSLQLVNNETGVITPDETLVRIGEACRAADVRFHLDATQAPGKIPLRLKELPVDLATISAHKLHGPKGAGALYVAPGVQLEPLFVGGPQEDDRRAGTENVPAIVGLGCAAELALEHVLDPAAPARVARLRDDFERLVRERIDGVRVHGAGAPRVGSVTNLGIPGLSGEALVCLLADAGVAASTGSACSSGKQGLSHVLLAMGVSEASAVGALRVSLSRLTSSEDLTLAAQTLEESVGILRALAPATDGGTPSATGLEA